MQSAFMLIAFFLSVDCILYALRHSVARQRVACLIPVSPARITPFIDL